MNTLEFFPYPFFAGLLVLILIIFLLRRRGWRYLAGYALFQLAGKGYTRIRQLI
jgi:hypothetical protein